MLRVGGVISSPDELYRHGEHNGEHERSQC